MEDIDKNVVALGWVSFFTDMASSMITSILPIFIVYILHEGVDKLGYVVAIATFVSYAFRILFGYLSDRYQRAKPFVVTGYALSALSKPLFYYAHNWIDIAIIRSVERLGKAIRSATKDSLIASYAGGKSGKTFGFHKMMDVAGEMSGAIIAFLVLYFLGKNEAIFRNLFALSLIPGLLAVGIVIFYVKDMPSRHKKIAYDLKSDLALLPVLLIYFAYLFFIFNDSFFIVEAKESGIGIEYIPLFAILLNFVQTATSLYLGIKIDRFGYAVVLGISFLLGILAMISLSLHWVVLAFIFLGLFTVGSLNAIRSFVSDRARNKGTVYGVLYAGIALFSSLGAAVMGWIWEHYGERTGVELSIAGLVLVTALFYLHKWSTREKIV